MTIGSPSSKKGAMASEHCAAPIQARPGFAIGRRNANLRDVYAALQACERGSSRSGHARHGRRRLAMSAPSRMKGIAARPPTRPPISMRRSAAGMIALALVAGCARELPPLVERAPGPPPPTIIRNVEIYDGLADRRTSARDVLIENGRIARIVPPRTLVRRAGMQQFDGTGQTLLPGLIDVHGHVGNWGAPTWTGEWPDAKRNLQSYLYCGVTTVLDPCDMAPDAFTRRDQVARGELLGPRIFAAGPMFAPPGGHPVAALHALVPWWLRWYVVRHIARQVATPEEGRAAVAALAPLHPDVIKVAVDAVPLEAADAGVAAWMHGVYKERIPDEAIPRLAAAGIPEVATLAVFDSYADLYEGRRAATALERETVPARILDAFVPVPASGRPPSFQTFFALLAATRTARRDNVRRMHAAGVTILAGSDAQTGVFPGPGLHRELAALVTAGLTPAQALRAATGDAARFVPRQPDPEFGAIGVGKIADLVM